jgi:hypothetical protein
MKHKKTETVLCKSCGKPLKLFGTLMFVENSVKHYYCHDCKEIKRKTL